MHNNNNQQNSAQKIANRIPMRWRMERNLAVVPALSWMIEKIQGRRKKVMGALEARRRLRSPLNLENFATGIYSQNGEDGMLAEIFRRIGITNGKFVEFGVQTGTQCCTRALLDQGWTGTWFEGVANWAEAARKQFGAQGVSVIGSFLTQENIVSEFRSAGVPSVPDLMSIDVDGCDYWLWNAVAPQFRARVVAIEYNASAGPRVDWVVPYDPKFRHDGTVAFGASLAALVRLGDSFGYKLVGCDPSGINAFFALRELVDDQFEIVGDPLQHYVSPHYGSSFGYPAR